MRPSNVHPIGSPPGKLRQSHGVHADNGAWDVPRTRKGRELFLGVIGVPHRIDEIENRFRGSAVIPPRIRKQPAMGPCPAPAASTLSGAATNVAPSAHSRPEFRSRTQRLSISHRFGSDNVLQGPALISWENSQIQQT